MPIAETRSPHPLRGGGLQENQNFLRYLLYGSPGGILTEMTI